MPRCDAYRQEQQQRDASGEGGVGESLGELCDGECHIELYPIE